MRLNMLIPISILTLCSLFFTGCEENEMQAVSLTTSMESAWDCADDNINEYAEEVCSSSAENPDMLIKDTEAEYISAFDSFTLTIPIDWGVNAAASLIFGEFGDFLTSLDSADRSSKTKKDARALIEKKFDDNWATLFASLCFLDGTFTLGYETDGMDNDFDFDAKFMKNMLEQKGILDGAYHDDGSASMD